MRYTQMVSYHVYVPLLLRLANDVEKNPGPINIIVLRFEQASTKVIYIHVWNKCWEKCVAMSIYAIVYCTMK